MTYLWIVQLQHYECYLSIQALHTMHSMFFAISCIGQKLIQYMLHIIFGFDAHSTTLTRRCYSIMQLHLCAHNFGNMVDDHIFGPPTVRGPPLPMPLLPWKYCVAKQKLTRDLTNGVIPLHGRVMNARPVQQTRPEYMLYELEFFAKRLAKKRRQMRQQNKNSYEDSVACVCA
jgi:hypothetical protein